MKEWVLIIQAKKRLGNTKYLQKLRTKFIRNDENKQWIQIEDTSTHYQLLKRAEYKFK
jgi:hypothetical protein